MPQAAATMPAIELQAAAYIRVSSKSFVQEDSFIFQKQYWEDRLSSLPNHKNVGVYSDTISGHFDKKRTGFTALINDALAGKIDIIYTKSISRFCRNMPLLLETLRKLADKGIAVIFEKENINSLDSKKNLILQVQGILAENDITNNKALVEKSRKQQFAEGRPYMCVMPYGFLQEHYPEFVINEEEAQHIRTIFEMFTKGRAWEQAGYRQIANHLNQLGVRSKTGKGWQDSTIKRILTNEKYVGDVQMQKTYKDENHIQRKNNGEVKGWYIENNHTGIITRELWDAAQAKLQENTRTYLKKRSCIASTEIQPAEPAKRGLREKIVCGSCGRNYKVRRDYTGNGLRKYYSCNKTKAGLCNGKAVPVHALVALAQDAYDEYAKSTQSQAGVLETRLKEALAEQASITALKDGRYITQDAFNKELDRILAELKRVDDSMRKTESLRDGGIEDHIDKVEVRDGILVFSFIDGQIIQRGMDYASSKAS